MKSYTIGREETCNIVIPDSTQMVSRNHATLTLNGSKMTITDNSSNGTYINGIRIASGTPVPVTRKDVVSFAQVAELDWGQIPNPGKRTLWIILAVIIALAAVGCGGWFYLKNRQAQQEEAAAAAAAAQQALSGQVDSLKTRLERANKAIESLKTSLAATKEECARKPADKLSKVNSLLSQVEEKVNTLNSEPLQKSLDAVTQSLEDGSDRTEQRVKEMTSQLDAFMAEYEAARAGLEEVRNLLSAIPDKPGAPKTKPAKVEVAPEQEPEQKQDSRVF